MADPIYEPEGEIDGEYVGDGWCIDCGDEFHLDDCGGYNPPCSCGFHCRSCHEREVREESDNDDDYCDVCGEWLNECICKPLPASESSAETADDR